MVLAKSLDEVKIIAALLRDAHALFGVVFNNRTYRLTLQKVEQRVRSEGHGFLTKTLPRLGKCFDQALTGVTKLSAIGAGFKPGTNSKLPRFLGELFSLVFQPDGSVLPDPNANCVKIIRQILYLFYKYELPYDETQEQQVIQSFKTAEEDLSNADTKFANMRAGAASYITTRRGRHQPPELGTLPCPEGDVRALQPVIREARILLSNLFSSFDPTDITPKHGPGAVATKQRHSEKFVWTNVCDRITDVYPFDAYFCASSGHVCDSYDSFDAITATDHSARVILVPKDSRGPRLISCEPVDFQWIQQGLRAAIYRLVETHESTRFNVFFTDQGPNRCGALLGSSTGKYVTLDLKEASDRVHLDLVRLLFPEHLHRYLEACRSVSTVLPDGQILPLKKFAPMGSALCFPIMALTIWAILTASAPNADTRESILVYGDDVIVPTDYSVSAMTILEEFGLKINRSKSCTQGSFRESCGMDAFNGVNVTPVRIRTVWDESPRPDVYSSWIAYANSFYDRQLMATYDYLVTALESVYGSIPDESMRLACPSLRCSPAPTKAFKRRTNAKLQKLEYKVRVLESKSVDQVINGWSMLLRYFTEASSSPNDITVTRGEGPGGVYTPPEPFSVSQYTKRDTSLLVWRWR